MPEASLLTRTLRIGSYGADVYGLKRTVLRGLDREDGGKRLKALETPRRYETAAMHARRKRTLGPFFVVHLNRMRSLLGFKRTGVADERLWHAMLVRGYADAWAIDLMNKYRDSRPPPKPPLVEPVQGFASLHKSLWEAYSIGRRMGLTDLGTHNAASTLPGGGPSDHSVWPAYAFDLGFTPQTGWANPTARAYAIQIAGRPEIEYVILGSYIWTNDGRGWRTYTSGNHANHVHCSGRR